MLNPIFIGAIVLNTRVCKWTKQSETYVSRVNAIDAIKSKYYIEDFIRIDNKLFTRMSNCTSITDSNLLYILPFVSDNHTYAIPSTPVYQALADSDKFYDLIDWHKIV